MPPPLPPEASAMGMPAKNRLRGLRLAMSSCGPGPTATNWGATKIWQFVAMADQHGRIVGQRVGVVRILPGDRHPPFAQPAHGVRRMLVPPRRSEERRVGLE